MITYGKGIFIVGPPFENERLEKLEKELVETCREITGEMNSSRRDWFDYTTETKDIVVKFCRENKIKIKDLHKKMSFVITRGEEGNLEVVETGDRDEFPITKLKDDAITLAMKCKSQAMKEPKDFGLGAMSDRVILTLITESDGKIILTERYDISIDGKHKVYELRSNI
jgi:hypothetical protein